MVIVPAAHLWHGIYISFRRGWGLIYFELCFEGGNVLRYPVLYFQVLRILVYFHLSMVCTIRIVLVNIR